MPSNCNLPCGEVVHDGVGRIDDENGGGDEAGELDHSGVEDGDTQNDDHGSGWKDDECGDGDGHDDGDGDGDASGVGDDDVTG